MLLPVERVHPHRRLASGRPGPADVRGQAERGLVEEDPDRPLAVDPAAGAGPSRPRGSGWPPPPCMLSWSAAGVSRLGHLDRATGQPIRRDERGRWSTWTSSSWATSRPVVAPGPGPPGRWPQPPGRPVKRPNQPPSPLAAGPWVHPRRGGCPSLPASRCRDPPRPDQPDRSGVPRSSPGLVRRPRRGHPAGADRRRWLLPQPRVGWACNQLGIIHKWTRPSRANQWLGRAVQPHLVQGWAFGGCIPQHKPAGPRSGLAALA
jgi:hypothetical protein